MTGRQSRLEMCKVCTQGQGSSRSLVYWPWCGVWTIPPVPPCRAEITSLVRFGGSRSRGGGEGDAGAGTGLRVADGFNANGCAHAVTAQDSAWMAIFGQSVVRKRPRGAA